jgi:hypothetical protein
MQSLYWSLSSPGERKQEVSHGRSPSSGGIEMRRSALELPKCRALSLVYDRCAPPRLRGRTVLLTRPGINLTRQTGLLREICHNASCSAHLSIAGVDLEIQLHIIADTIVLQGELVFEGPFTLPLQQDLVRLSPDHGCNDDFEILCEAR